jgi:uncharacterized protein YjbJ (UPF0337 family)
MAAVFSVACSHSELKRPAQPGQGTGGTEVNMNKPVIPSVSEVKGKWKHHLGAAGIAWGELTDDEIFKAKGHQDKPAGLIQERCAVTRVEAERQVRDFFAKLAP